VPFPFAMNHLARRVSASVAIVASLLCTARARADEEVAPAAPEAAETPAPAAAEPAAEAASEDVGPPAAAPTPAPAEVAPALPAAARPAALALAPTLPAGAESYAPARSSSIYTKDGLLGPVRLGPMVGAGVPDGIRFGLFAKWRGILGGGVAGSMLPTFRIPGTTAQVERLSGEVFARVHPFRGAFFAGVAGGYAQTAGSATKTERIEGQSISGEARADASVFYVAPQVGFQWMLPGGITAGFDVGVAFPVAHTGPNFEVTAEGQTQDVEAKGRVADAMKYVVSMPVPVVHLLELGYAL